MKTHLRTRAFILCFLPFAILLTSSFWMIQRFVQSTVREGLHTSLRESQVAIASIHAKGDLQNSRFLRARKGSFRFSPLALPVFLVVIFSTFGWNLVALIRGAQVRARSTDAGKYARKGGD